MKALGALMERGIRGGAFPGGVLLAAKKGVILFHEAFGCADLFSRREMTVETRFDLASLTKPLATTLAILNLHQEKRISVEQPAADLLPAFTAQGKKQITLRRLLCHESGLPAYRPYYLKLAKVHPSERKARLRRWLAEERLERPVGAKAVYSDLGFMILEWVAEAVSQKSLDAYLKDAVYDKIFSAAECGLFFPGTATLLGNIPYAATEFCTWRNQLMIGAVHDENAFVTGGVAGHSGLFGSALDVWRLLSVLLSDFIGRNETPLFRREILEMAFSPSAVGGRALGFDTPAPEGASCGRHFSRRTIGHLGFTGTSFWVDLDRQVAVILLTHRIHPYRGNEKIRMFRPVLHDAVMAAIG